MSQVRRKLKKDDKVKILAGKDRAKEAKVLRVDHLKGRVIVEGLNLVHKTKKPQKEGETGGIVEVEAAIDISNLILVCPKCSRATRVAYLLENNSKKRICKRCREEL